MTQDTQTQTNAPTETAVAPTSAFAELVGDGRKFKTPEDLAIGKKTADLFIGKLESENRDLRRLLETLSSEVQVLKTRTEFADRLNSNNDDASQASQTNARPQVTNQTTTTTSQPQMGPDDVIKLVEQREAASTAMNNLRQVNDVLVREYGAEAKDFIARKAVELGVTEEYIANTAKISPQAFYSLTGFQPSTSRNTTLTSRVQGSPSSRVSGTPQIRNQAYYDGLKAQMGATKYALDSNLQKQMWRDIAELGDRFTA